MPYPKISIIVPVYNTEKYLNRCVDSILTQSFSDFELLLVNDGSTDKSGSICDDYACQDSRVRVLHKVNGGVSSARNSGLDNAKGEWIMFVDSDDWIINTQLEDLVKYPTYDLRVNNYQLYGSDEAIGGELPDARYNGNEQIYECLIEYFSTNFKSACGKRFKMSIIEKHSLRFENNISMGEDLIFVLDYLKYTNSISLSSLKGLIYNRVNESSLTHNNSNYTPVRFITRVENTIDVLERKFSRSLRSLTLSLIIMDFCELIERLLTEKTYQKRINELREIMKVKSIKQLISDDEYIEKGKRRKIVDFLLKNNCYHSALLVLQKFKHY